MLDGENSAKMLENKCETGEVRNQNRSIDE